MIIAKIIVSGTSIRSVWSHRITRGMIGAKVQIEYDGDTWQKLNRTAVFQGAVTKDVLNIDNEVTIPTEVVAKSGLNLFMGLYGTDADNNIAIPTIWIPLGVIQSGADPSGDETTDPTLPVWAQLEQRFATLMHLAEHPAEMTAVADWAATDLDPGHILNRTHWLETIESNNTFNGELAGRNAMQIDDGLYLVKMSDDVFTVDDLLGHTLTLYMRGEDPEMMTYKLTTDNTFDMSSEGVPVVMACEGLWCIQYDFAIDGFNFEAGTYYLCVTDEVGVFAYAVETSRLPSVQEIIHKLDTKFLDAEWLPNMKSGMETVLPETTQLFNGKNARQTFIFNVENGKQYRVSWDGTSYDRIATQYGDALIYFNMIGNQSMCNSTLEDNGDPFCVASLYLGGYLLSTHIYTSELAESHTIGISRIGMVRNRVPYEYLPQVYVMPTDFGVRGIQMAELAEANRILDAGGKVLARYNNTTYQVLHAFRDHIDNQYDTLCMVNSFNFYLWSKQRGWTVYSFNSFTLPTENYYVVNGNVTQGKKFKFTVDETGTLTATDVTGQL